MHTHNLPIQLEFDNSFFKEETRYGYHITEKSKRVMAVQLDLLDILLRICRKHGIEVYAYAGTLLGAVRHQGFIPWDDDIDVCMTRRNFELFCKLAPKELDNPYFLQTAISDRRFFLEYARLRNSLTTGLILENFSDSYNNGIYIDVFVLDEYIDDNHLLFKQMWVRDKLRSIAQAYHSDDLRNNEQKLSLLKYFVYKMITSIVPYVTVVYLYKKNLTRYNSRKKRVSMMTHAASFFRKYWCYFEDLDTSPNLLQFENLMIPVPKNYDMILRNFYGNYWEYPPVDKRGTWHEGIIELDPDTPYLKYISNKKMPQYK